MRAALVAYRTLHGSAVLIALGGLLTTGTPFAEALRVVEASASRWLAGHLDTIHLRIRTGLAAGEAMDMHLFRFAEVGGDLADYGRLSNFERAVVLLGRRTIERVLGQVAAATALANTGLILIIAGSVLWMYVSFMAISDAATSTFK
jgi:type II secretory pathway component PulF